MAALVTGCLFDEESGKRTEDERLNASAKPVKVSTGNSGNTDSEEGDLAKEAAKVVQQSKYTQQTHDNADNKKYSCLVMACVSLKNH